MPDLHGSLSTGYATVSYSILQVQNSLTVGYLSPGYLTVEGGDVDAGNIGIGYQAGSSGNATISQGSILTSASTLSVGYAGWGYLDVNSGSDVQAVNLEIGGSGSPGGSVDIDGVGSAFNVDQYVTVGDGAAGVPVPGSPGNYTSVGGFLGITNGASASLGIITVGYQPGSSGGIYVIGSGSTLEYAAGTTLGYQGYGYLVVEDNAEVASSSYLTVGFEGTGYFRVDSSATATLGQLEIGTQAAASGTVIIDGPGSHLDVSASYLTVGDGATGTPDPANSGSYTTTGGYLGITNGGTAEAGYLVVAYQPGSSGGVDVTGSTSALTLDGGSTIGYQGYGYVNLRSGATLVAHGNLGVGYLGTATLSVSGGSRLSLSGPIGGNADGLGLTIGGGSGGLGHVSVDGSGTILDDNGYLTVADAATGVPNPNPPGGYAPLGGSLTITNGAAVKAIGTTVANQSGSSGDILVTGGSTLMNSTNANIGSNGLGFIEITTGGAFVTDSMDVGDGSGAIGGAEVDGDGSSITDKGFLIVGDSATGTPEAGNPGSIKRTNGFYGGIVTVTGGATMTAAGITAGLQPGSLGAILVTGTGLNGTGSSLVDASNTTIGAQGSGYLDVEGGGRFTTGNLTIGTNAGAEGLVAVDGTGSIATVNGSLVVGDVAVGTPEPDNPNSITRSAGLYGGQVTVSNGGTMTAAGITVGLQPGSLGAIIITGANASLTNSGDATIGSQGSGYLDVESGGNFTTRNLTIAASAGARGLVNVSGSNGWLPSSIDVVGSAVVTPGTSGSYGTGGVTPSGVVTVSGTGTITVGSGGELDAGAMAVGNFTSAGTVNVQASGSLNTQFLFLQNQDTRVTVASGGTLTIGGASPVINSLVLNGGAITYAIDNQSSPLIHSDAAVQFLSGTITLEPSAVAFNPSPDTEYTLLEAPAGALSKLLKGYTAPVSVVSNGESYLAIPLTPPDPLVQYTPATTPSILVPYLNDSTTQNNQGRWVGNSDYLVPSVTGGSTLVADVVRLNYAPPTGVTASLSTDQEYLIAQLAADSGVSQIEINSTDRTIDEQARIMVQNLVKAFQAADLGSADKYQSVPSPGLVQQSFYQLFLGEGPAVEKDCQPARGGCYQALIDSTDPGSTFATTCLNYDSSTRAFSVKANACTSSIPQQILDLAYKDIIAAQAANGGATISQHVANNSVQALDIQIGTDAYSDLSSGAVAREFLSVVKQFIGEGSVTRVLCPSDVGCSKSEGGSKVFHLELDNYAADPFPNLTPILLSATPSGSTYQYGIGALANSLYNEDPAAAYGYLFQEDAASPLFSSVLLPDVPLVNGYYEVDVNNGFGWQFAADIPANERYFFILPTDEFRVFGVDTSAFTGDFVPQITFEDDGTYNGTITLLTAAELSTIKIWSPTAATSDWTSGGNWTAGTVPEASSTAEFAGSQQTDIVIENTVAQTATLQFDSGAPAYTFHITGNAAGAAFMNIGGQGIVDNSSNPPSFVVSGAAGNIGTLEFDNAADAGDALITADDFGVVIFTGISNAGTATLTANGSGLVDFSGTQGPAGDGNVSAGAIAGSGTFHLGNDTLTVGSNNASTEVSGAIADGGFSGGSGALLIKVGTGTLTLSGVNTYTGRTTISGGTLALSGAGSIAASSGVTDNNIFDISAANAGVSIRSLSGGGTVMLGSQTLTLTNANDTFAGIIIGGGGLTITGGSEMLSGANTYTGLTVIGGGTLALSGGGSIAASSSVTDNNIFDISATNAGASVQSLSGNGAVMLGTQTLMLTNANDIFAGDISGAGGFAITGGVEMLGGANTFSGGTTVDSATLVISSDTNLGNGGVLALMNGATLAVTATGIFVHDVTVAGDPTFNIASGTTVSWTGLISGGATPGDVVVTGGGTFEPLNPANSYSGGTSVIGGSTILVLTDGKLGDAAGGLTLGDASTVGTLKLSGTFDLAASRTFTLGAGGGTIDTNGFAMTVSQSIGGTGSLTKAGTGMLTLTGTNTYTGWTTISGGTLALSWNGSIAASSGVADSAAFDISATSSGASIQSLSGNGAVALGGQTLTLTNASDVFTGEIVGSGGLNLTAGWEMLSGVNSYTGATAISGGTFALGGNGSIAASWGVADNGTFDISATNSGASIQSLSGNGLVALGTQTLTLTNASGTFAGVIGGSGGLTVTAGTENLTGANTYTGLTTISGGTLALAGDGSIATSAGVADNGTFDISATNSGASIQSLSGNGSVVLGAQSLTLTNAFDTFAGTIGGADGLNMVGGVETLTGANTYAGGTTISGGALQLGNGGTIGSIVGNVTDNALLVFNRSDTVIFGGVISGTGAVWQLGSGTTILTAANSYTGGTAIAAGTLQLGNGGTSGWITGNVSDNATLAFKRSDSVTFAGIISGSGGVQQNGSGTLTLSATNTYTGATTVNAGTLAVSGSIASSSGLTINAGVTLAGTGTVPKTNVLAGGTVAPGNGGIGTLHVNGNLALASGSTYAVETTPTANDQLSVTGSASLAGTLAVTPTGSYNYNQTITVVSAPGGIIGGFGTLTTGTFGFNLVAVLGYGPNSAFLVLEPIAISPLLPANASVNQTNVAAAIDFAMAKDGKRALYSPLANLSASDLGNTLSQLSGELPNGEAQAGFTIAGSFLETMLDPLVDGRGDTENGAPALSFLSNPVRVAFNGPANQTPTEAPAPHQPVTVWGAALGGWANTQGNTQLGTHSTNSSDGALVLGADFRPNNGNSVVGLAGSIGQTWWNVPGGLGSGHSDVRQIGIYGSTRFDQFYLSGSASLAFFKAKTARTVTFGGASLYSAKFNAQSEGGRLELGRRFLTDDGVGLTPYIGLQAMQFRSPTYAETTVSGSPQFALAYTKKAQSNVAHDVGIQVDDMLSVGTDNQIDLNVRAGWLHDYSSSLDEQAEFNAYPDAMFIVHGASQAKDAARISVGLETGVADGLVFQLKAQSELSNRWQTYGGNATVAYHW